MARVVRSGASPCYTLGGTHHLQLRAIQEPLDLRWNCDATIPAERFALNVASSPTSHHLGPAEAGGSVDSSELRFADPLAGCRSSVLTQWKGSA